MGAYLSNPLTEKESTDEINDYLACGASQMQGWRMSQEDAHICSLDFDKSISLFAVFDGHGGSEVALYCSKKLPDFLKTTDAYKTSDYEQALKDAFLGFDATLIDGEVVKELREIMSAKMDESTEEDGDDDDEDISELHQESHMPLEELLEKLKAGNIPLNKLKQGEGSGAQPLSPFLRGRRNGPAADGNSQNGEAKEVTKQQVDVDAAEEAVSSSSATAAIDKGQSSAEPISSSITASETPASSDSTNDAQSDNGTSNNSGDTNSFNSPDSSSTTNENSDRPTEPSPDQNKVKTGNDTDSSSNEVEAEANGKDENVSSSTAQNGSIASKKLNELEDSDGSNGGKPKQKPVSDEETESFEEDVDENEEEEDEGEDEEEDDDDEEDALIEDEEESEDDMCTFEDDEKFLNNMLEGPGLSSGCTAVVALLAGNELFVANAGDSRCVVCRNGTALEMSVDHKPEDTEELERIVKAGGRVTRDGRVNGGLNLSRAIGDHAYKTNKGLKAEEQMISAMPDIKRATITADDEFMVLACDGIWNSLTSAEVVEFVRSRIQAGETKMSAICEEMFTKCLAPNTHGDGTGCDNMTAVIIQFKPLLVSDLQKNNVSEKVDVDTTTTSSVSTKKRPASPTSLIDASNDDAPKRIKTDDSTDVNGVVEMTEPASA